MINDLKQVISDNKANLPILSHYWEMEEAGTMVISKEEKEHSLQLISSVHNTSKYTLHTLYKPISTIFDLNNYE